MVCGVTRTGTRPAVAGPGKRMRKVRERKESYESENESEISPFTAEREESR